jgi:hypothetical protein
VKQGGIAESIDQLNDTMKELVHEIREMETNDESSSTRKIILVSYSSVKSSLLFQITRCLFQAIELKLLHIEHRKMLKPLPLILHHAINNTSAITD